MRADSMLNFLFGRGSYVIYVSYVSFRWYFQNFGRFKAHGTVTFNGSDDTLHIRTKRQ